MSISTTYRPRLYVTQYDQLFDSFDALFERTTEATNQSNIQWVAPSDLYPVVYSDRLQIKIAGDRAYELNDWSFSQLCRLLRADRAVFERLSPTTVCQALREMFPIADRTLQMLIRDDTIIAIDRIRHQVLYDSELLGVVVDYADELTERFGESTSYPIYSCGERDMYAVLLKKKTSIYDWGDRFHPAFVVRNSEVRAGEIGVYSCWYACDLNAYMLDATEGAPTAILKRTSSIGYVTRTIQTAIEEWLDSYDRRSDELYQQLVQTRNKSFATGCDALQNKLRELGIAKKQRLAIAKALATEISTFSIRKVLEAILAESSKATFARERFQLAKVCQEIIKSMN